MEKKHYIWCKDFDTSPATVQEFRDDPPFADMDASSMPTTQVIKYLEILNNEYLDDERTNLDKKTAHPVVAVYTASTTGGEVFGFHTCGRNINSIFDVANNAIVALKPIGFWGDGKEIFAEVDLPGGTKTGEPVTVLFRQLSEEQCQELFDVPSGNPAFKDIFMKNTKSIFPDVAKIYGWPVG